MFSKLKQIISDEDEQQSIFSNLNDVKFDRDFEEDPLPFEKYLSVSSNVQDTKGNPGSLGKFFVTNLRLIWQMKNDPLINLVAGFDSIKFIEVQTIAVQWGNGFKHTLSVKAQNPSQVRYQFKFCGCNPEDLTSFKMAESIYKKMIATKSFRCLSLSVKFNDEYQPMEGEQLKSTYQDCKFYEDQQCSPSILLLTNTRVVIIRPGSTKMNWGIPWMMIRGIEPVDEDFMKGIQIKCRGAMSKKLLVIECMKGSEAKKLSLELKSFGEVYNKCPVLGFGHDELKIQKVEHFKKVQNEILEFETLKININRRKKAYEANGTLGSVLNTQFNEQIGLLMEKIPEGVTREDLWEIMK